MYTSGSTGKPKGVVITHAQIVSAIASGMDCLKVEAASVYIAYLPLAHIMELMAEHAMMAAGCELCYADPKTLTAKGAYPVGALEQFSPTHMVGVPKIWDVIKKGVEAKVAASSPVAKFLVQTAFEWRTFAINHGFDTPLFKVLVFKKFSKVVGGNLQLAASGGGPLNAEVQIFIRTCFGCPTFQGYVSLFWQYTITRTAHYSTVLYHGLLCLLSSILFAFVLTRNNDHSLLITNYAGIDRDNCRSYHPIS
jgi:long-chain acyl-CoA synthetase